MEDKLGLWLGSVPPLNVGLMWDLILKCETFLSDDLNVQF